MTESEAVETAERIARVYPEVHAFPLNPRTTMTLTLDRWTAQMIRDAVASYVGPGETLGACSSGSMNGSLKPSDRRCDVRYAAS